MNTEEEISKLVKEIKRLGSLKDGKITVPFGVLVKDDQVANICNCTIFIQIVEALVGTLKAAKKRKVLIYDSELLLQGVHDNVEITLIN